MSVTLYIVLRDDDAVDYSVTTAVCYYKNKEQADGTVAKLKDLKNGLNKEYNALFRKIQARGGNIMDTALLELFQKYADEIRLYDPTYKNAESMWYVQEVQEGK